MTAGPLSDPSPEINTTPLIDVMLVLLIMFIITIPIQTHAVPIDLPAAKGATEERDRNKVVVDAGGALRWNGTTVDLATLSALLVRVGADPDQPETHLEPDPEAPYERVDEVLAVMRRANVTRLGFIGNERYARF